MRAGIAQPLGGGPDLDRGGAGDPIGLRVDVGRRHDRHPGRVGDLAHCRPASLVSHAYTVLVYRYTMRSRRDSPDDLRAEALDRDAPTLLGYGTIAAYAFWLYAFGPELALLRAEIHFSYATLGLYSALWAAGAALTGMVFA